MFDRQSLSSLLTLVAGVAATVVVIALQPEPRSAHDSAAPIHPVCESTATAGSPAPCAVAVAPCMTVPTSVDPACRDTDLAPQPGPSAPARSKS